MAIFSLTVIWEDKYLIFSPTTHVRMAERSKAPDSRVELFLTGVFWSTNVGVGSNPTSDKVFTSDEMATCGDSWLLWNRKQGVLSTPMSRTAQFSSFSILERKRSHATKLQAAKVVRGTSSNGRALA